MKTEVDIITVSNGKITEIKMFDELYSVHLKDAGVIEIKLNPERLKPRKVGRPKIKKIGPDKGQKVAQHYHNSIFENVLNEISTAKTSSETEKIIRKYYPNHKRSSVRGTASNYRSYLRSHPIVTESPKTKPFRKTYRNIENAYARSEKYNLWVKNEDVQKVKLAVSKVAYGYRPTSDVIERETHLTKWQVRAVLDVLLEQGIIIKTREGRDIIYKLPYSRPETQIQTIKNNETFINP